MTAPTDAGADTVVDTTAGKIKELHRLREAVRSRKNPSVDKQHGKGRLTVRERIALLLDPGSFIELDEFARHRCVNFGAENKRPPGDAVVTGYGLVHGRRVYLYGMDATVLGGTVGEVGGEKICKVLDLAIATGCPVVGINDSGGARVHEGVVSLAVYAEIARRVIHASGMIPQISLIMGACAGGAVYVPAATDFIVMVDKTSHMFVTGPEITRMVTGEDIEFEDLGGAAVHGSRSGCAHQVAPDEPTALELVRELLAHLPSNNLEDPPVFYAPPADEVTERDRELDGLIPDQAERVYDMREVIERVVDDGHLLEIQPHFARNIITGFGRIEGHSVGIVANQPMHAAGIVDIDAAEKAARFIRICDSFNLPVLTFVDVPGFMPGTAQEWNGIIRRGVKLAFAYCSATVPLLTVITRKAYGGGYAVMGSKHLGADINLAWPTAQVAVMGARSAVELLHRRRLGAAEDPQAARLELIREYEETVASPYIAADRGYVDTIIAPAETRIAVAEALRALRDKRKAAPAKKHDNCPT